jgi:hypothetical protein
LWAGIERRGWAAEYWNGQVIQQWTNFDSVVGHTVAEEVALQLDAMHSLGVNTLSFDLTTADADDNFTFPTCHINPVAGLHWPQPTSIELTNLQAFFDLAQSKGFKIILILTDTHMEEMPRTNSQTWLSSILNVTKSHAALDSIVFYGDAHTIDTNGDGVPDSCGGLSEPPLWLGATAVPATFIKWAISYAMSLGVPSSKLSAGAIVGDYFTESQPPAGPDATDGHLWSPIAVLKTIFDQLSIPNYQRLYVLSFYEHRKCATAQSLPCTEAGPPAWAEQTVQHVFSVIGWGSGARVIASEMGDYVPVESTWNTSQAIPSLLGLMAKYSIDGGSFWRWTSFTNSEDQDSTLAQPIKLRGTSFTYTAAETILSGYYTGASALTPPLPIFFLYNASARQSAMWYLNNNVRLGSATGPVINAGWSMVGADDFNGDRQQDYLLFNSSTRQTGIWYFRGVTRIGSAAGPILPVGWTVAATGDANNDGEPDLVLWNSSTRQTAIWYMNNNLLASQATGPTLPSGWSLIGVADFNHDGHLDYLLLNPSTRQTAIWYMSGVTRLGAAYGPTISAGWQLIGAADINADGKPDYVLLKPSTGQTAIWYLNNNVYVSSAFGPTLPSGWSLLKP